MISCNSLGCSADSVSDSTGASAVLARYSRRRGGRAQLAVGYPDDDGGANVAALPDWKYRSTMQRIDSTVYPVVGTGHIFKFSVDVRFDSFANSDFPYILQPDGDSGGSFDNGIITLHGLGQHYGANAGKIAFYMTNAASGTGGTSNRCGSDVSTTSKLNTGEWYRVVLEKGADYVRLAVAPLSDLNSVDENVVSATCNVADFKANTAGGYTL